MRKSLLIASLILATQISFADDTATTTTPAVAPTDAMQQPMAAPASDGDNRSCKVIAKACLNGGYSRKGGPGKTFWNDCMHPILLGKSVTSINVDANAIQACKQFKISKMQQELNELQATMPAQAQ